VNPAVAGAGEGDEQRRPERLAVRRRVGLADRPRGDFAAGKLGRILPPPRGPLAALGPGRQYVAAHAAAGDFLVQLARELIEFVGVAVVGVGSVACGLRGRAPLDPHALHFVRRAGLEDGFVVEVPALAALRCPQGLGAFGAGRAHAGEGVPARHENVFGAPSVQVGFAELDRADAAAVVDGELPHDIACERLGEAFGAGAALGHSPSLSPGSVVHQVVR